MKVSTINFLTAAQLIVSGKSPAYRFGSDRINNYELFVTEFAKNHSEDAKQVIQDIEETDIDYITNYTNMTDRRLGITKDLLTKTLYA